MDYNIEIATKEDNKWIITLLTKYRDEFNNFILENREDVLDCPNYYEKRNWKFWVVKNEKNDIIGSVWVHKIEYAWKENWFLRRLYIDKNFRWLWLWEKLLQECEKFWNNKWWQYLIFWVDKLVDKTWWLRKFYLKHWYEEFFDDIPQLLLEDNDDWYYRKNLMN